jgi:hypothetical protein
MSTMLLIVFAVGLEGCDKNRHMVIAATATNIGVEISQNPATQQPQAKLGYQRTELAIVPSNRSTENSATAANSMGNGALDVADVIMELRYGGIFDVGATSGIYQRLAVGKEAVAQPGAHLMFAKDADGKVSDPAVDALKSIASIKPISATTRTQLGCLAAQRKSDAAKKNLIDTAVRKVTGDRLPTLDKFADSKPTDDQMKPLMDELKSQGFTDC